MKVIGRSLLLICLGIAVSAMAKVDKRLPEARIELKDSSCPAHTRVRHGDEAELSGWKVVFRDPESWKRMNASSYKYRKRSLRVQIAKAAKARDAERNRIERFVRAEYSTTDIHSINRVLNNEGNPQLIRSSNPLVDDLKSISCHYSFVSESSDPRIHIQLRRLIKRDKNFKLPEHIWTPEKRVVRAYFKPGTKPGANRKNPSKTTSVNASASGSSNFNGTATVSSEKTEETTSSTKAEVYQESAGIRKSKTLEVKSTTRTAERKEETRKISSASGTDRSRSGKPESVKPNPIKKEVTTATNGFCPGPLTERMSNKQVEEAAGTGTIACRVSNTVISVCRRGDGTHCLWIED